MPAERGLGFVEATAALAAISLRRVRRTRTLWIAAALAMVPAVVAAIAGQVPGSPAVWELLWHEVLGAMPNLFVVLPPLLIGGSVGEELDEQSSTYLWSRPLPRFAVAAGKLAALVPVTVAMMTVGMLIGCLIGGGVASEVLLRGVFAVFLGVLAIGAASVALAAISPRFGTRLALAYVLLIDRPMGNVPASIQDVSITHHVDLLVTPPEPVLQTRSILALVIITAVWLGVAYWRIRSRE